MVDSRIVKSLRSLPKRASRQIKKQRIGYFASSDSGSILPATAGALVMLISMMGLSIDGARIFYTKDVLQKSLDAAGLAAGNALTEAAMLQDAQNFFDANFDAGNTAANFSELNITPSQDGNTLWLTATATVESSFAKLLGFREFTVNARAEIQRVVRGMELALIMDNTGSMAGSKMTSMKSAAEDLVAIVYGDDESNENLYVSLIPYTAAVNVGPEYTEWLTSAGEALIDGGAYGPDPWKGCVMARSGGRDETDASPSIAKFTPYLYQDNVDNDWMTVDEDGETEYDLNLVRGNSGRGPNLGCGPAITPLIQSKTAVLEAVDEMEAWSRGGTTSNLGLVWGWRTLSPNWRGLWQGDDAANRPLDYGSPFMDKVAVVLTDGNNQFFDWKSHAPDNGNGPLGSDFTAYDRLNTFGFSSLGSARNELNDRFAATCGAMKAQGIIIYTITFGSGSSGAANLYRACASDPSFYFHAPSNGDLAEVFEVIGRSLSNLRLSQ